MLNNQEKKNSFIGKLSDVVNQQKFEVISATIQKEALNKHYRYDNNPYHIALKFETLNSFQIIRFFEYAKRQYKYWMQLFKKRR
jgi:hypothetical protein